MKAAAATTTAARIWIYAATNDCSDATTATANTNVGKRISKKVLIT